MSKYLAVTDNSCIAIMLMGMALNAQGIANVTFVDISDNRLELASSFGFKAVASGSDDMREWHRGADLVVEATGVPAVASGLTIYMANGGKGLFFGVCSSNSKIDIGPFEVLRRQLTLVGSHSLNHSIPRASDVLTGLGETVERAVSHKLPLRDIA